MRRFEETVLCDVERWPESAASVTGVKRQAMVRSGSAIKAASHSPRDEQA